MTKQTSRLLMALLLPVLVVACASTPTATTDFDPTFDFAGVRRVAILPVNRNVSPISEVSDMQVARMNQSLADELSRRGIEIAPDVADADMFLTWHLVTQERTDIRTYNTMSARHTNCWNCTSQNVRVRQYTQGTLIVDLIDPARNISVWRSIFESRLRDQSADQAAENRRVAADAIFAEFPPA